MKILIIPGLDNSGPEHWQTFWEKKIPGAVRVNQANWQQPEREAWIESLNSAINAVEEDILLVAHSLGVALVAHWAARYVASHVKGALLVSPSDVDSPEHTPDAVRGFAPMPLLPLPFRSIAVASSNDTFVSLERAQLFATRWGAEFVNAGALGHINSASGLEDWPQGLELLGKF